jgi:BirA family biotin operon repressor/biotin-[acetyl-CoA-carboxylase] ligase
VRLLVYDTIASTNDEGLARARLSEPGPVWITAARQTAGRGRRGRSFISEPGNLYATLLLTNACAANFAAELSFVAALALYDALATTAPELTFRLALKWPNDVLCDEKKLAGILIEGEFLASGALATVVGIGVNCAHHPEGMAYRATDLAAAGAQVSPPALLRALSTTMLQRLHEWDQGRGFAATRRAWLARAFGLGNPIRIVLADRQLEGRFDGLDPAGRLILGSTDGSLVVVTAGDVFPISAAVNTAEPATLVGVANPIGPASGRKGEQT